MKNKLTLTIILIAALGLGIMIATLVLNQLLSEERLRIMLIEPAEAQLGRKIDIGAINVSLFSGINIDNITVHGKTPGKNFLTIATFRLNYQLLPLLQKQLVITEILIDHPTLNLARNSEGVFNFADLSMTPKKIEKENLPPEEQPIEPLPLTLIFNKITVNNADLTFTDQTGKLPEILSTNGNLNLSLTLADKLAESSYQGTLDLILNAAYPGHKPVLIMNCDFNQEQASFKGDLNVEFERFFYNGVLTNPLTDPDLTLNVQSPSLDLAKLVSLDPEAKEVKPAKANAESAPSVSADAEPIPSTSASADAEPAPSAPTDAEPAPLAPIDAEPAPSAPSTNKFRTHGQIAIASLKHGELAFHNLNLNYVFKDQQLALNDVTFDIFGGQVTSQLMADLSRSGPDFQGKIKAEKLRMTEAMASLGKPAGYLSGELSADIAFHGAGRSWPIIRNTLAGEGKFSLIKGGLANSPYSQALATVLDLPELNDLHFEYLDGTVKISGGRIALLCTMSSPEFDLQGKGSTGLDGSLDLPLTLQLSQENSSRLKEKSKYTGYLADEYWPHHPEPQVDRRRRPAPIVSGQ